MGFRGGNLCHSPSNEGVKKTVPASIVHHSSSSSTSSSSSSSLSSSSSPRSTRRRLERQRSKQSSSTRNTTTTTTTTKRRVHFETDDQNNIVRHSLSSSARLGDSERSALWWTPQETEMMNDRTNMIANSYRDDGAFVQKYIQLFTTCAQTKDGTLPYTSEAYQLVQASTRGLELVIVSVLQRYRQKHIEAVLDAQDELSDLANMVEKGQLISEFSEKYSRPSSLLAQLVARTDAEFVASAF